MCAIEAISRAFGGLVVLFDDTEPDNKKKTIKRRGKHRPSENFGTRYNQRFKNAPDKFSIRVRGCKIQ
jgi:hypothetical protein